MATTEQVPFLVVGGGIGGLVTAYSVASAGYPVHVIEKSPCFQEIGAGLQLAPNATRILARLGVFEAVDEVSVKIRRVMLMDADSGRHLTTLDLGAAFRARYGPPYIVVHRGELLDIILDACQQTQLITLENNKEVIDFSGRPDSVLVTCKDGTTYDCDAVVGADGLWSSARDVVCNDQTICHGFVAYRGAIPVDDIGFSIDPNDEYIWIGPRKHFVQYPISRGTVYNQVAVFKSQLFRPEIADSLDWGTAEELEAEFSGCCPQVREALMVIQRDRRWPMFDREPAENWTLERLTLLGDAAHPMLQYLAQGACQAIEDADCMARMMQKFNGDIPSVFAHYQAERIPRTAMIQSVARWWGRVWHDEGDLVPGLRNRIFSSRAPDDYSDLDWLYNLPE